MTARCNESHIGSFEAPMCRITSPLANNITYYPWWWYDCDDHNDDDDNDDDDANNDDDDSDDYGDQRWLQWLKWKWKFFIQVLVSKQKNFCILFKESVY